MYSFILLLINEWMNELIVCLFIYPFINLIHLAYFV